MKNPDIFSITPADVGELEKQIPEFSHRYDSAQVEERLNGKQSLLIGAHIDGICIGYKVGYEFEPRKFYSWLGGVIPQYRRQGIAQSLMHWQENWAQQNGYQLIRVKSENRYKSMLILLLKNGYDIVGVETCGAVHFQKRFITSSTPN